MTAKASSVLSWLVPPITFKIYHYLNAELRRPIVRRQLAGYEKIHLGCGNNILAGWANIDLYSSQLVIGWNLTFPLPIKSNSIEFIFCEHFIEHISIKQGTEFLSECYRVLKPKGVLRISTPSLEKVVEEYRVGRTIEWTDVGWNPESPCKMLNESFRLWGHQFLYDQNELKNNLQIAGFSKVTPVPWHVSTYDELRNLESRPDHGEIIVEVIK